MNHISPNKTWSGVVGGTAAALVVCTYLSWAAGLQPLAGIGVGYAVSPALRVGLDYDITRFKAHESRGPLQMLGLAVQYSF